MRIGRAELWTEPSGLFSESAGLNRGLGALRVRNNQLTLKSINPVRDYVQKTTNYTRFLLA